MRLFDVRCDCGRLLFRRAENTDGLIEIRCMRCKRTSDIRMQAMYSYATT